MCIIMQVEQQPTRVETGHRSICSEQTSDNETCYPAQFCNGLSYVSTVYSITVPVKMAAELSLNEMHVAMNTSGSACVARPAWFLSFSVQ
jgi:hypothetical protein